MATHSFKDLKVWQRSMDLTVSVYKIVSQLPPEEKYSLADQLRRCSVSVPSNIAEGQKRNSQKEFVHFCSIARGSLAELETQLELAHRLYDCGTSLEQLECREISKMISGLVKSQR